MPSYNNNNNTMGFSQDSQPRRAVILPYQVQKAELGFSPSPSVNKSHSSSSSFSTAATATTSDTAITTSETVHVAALSAKSTTPTILNHEQQEEDETTTSDVSSISSTASSSSLLEEIDEDTASFTPRTIFSTYWEKKGGAPGSLRCTGTRQDEDDATRHAHSRIQDRHRDSARNTYERVLSTQEQQEQKSTTSRRRTIFQGRYHSDPQLSLSIQRPSRESLRKTRSTSALNRPPRISSDHRSVTFSPRVSVVVFTTPQEQWARQGWSDYFV